MPSLFSVCIPRLLSIVGIKKFVTELAKLNVVKPSITWRG
jgi:hypothetical protein